MTDNKLAPVCYVIDDIAVVGTTDGHVWNVVEGYKHQDFTGCILKGNKVLRYVCGLPDPTALDRNDYDIIPCAPEICGGQLYALKDLIPNSTINDILNGRDIYFKERIGSLAAPEYQSLRNALKDYQQLLKDFSIHEMKNQNRGGKSY